MNYQNIPRSDKVIKAAFVPKLDALLLLDYKNIEPRLLAYYMAELGDESFAEVFRRGKDPYVELARVAFNKTDISDTDRQLAKVLLLAVGYGAQKYRVRDILGVRLGEAEQVLQSINEGWPGIELAKTRISERLAERGYITTLWGRHLRPESEHKALNALIQGCAADMMKAALVKVDRALMDAAAESHMVSVIHDEIILDATEQEIPWLVKAVPGLMRDERVQSVVPIEVDVEISRTTWANKEAYEDSQAA